MVPERPARVSQSAPGNKVSYSVSQAILATDIGKNELLRLLGTGAIKGFRVGAAGGKWIIPRFALEEWMRAEVEAAGRRS